MNDVILWYVSTLQRLFHFVACVSLFSFSIFFFLFFVDFATSLGIEVSLPELKGTLVDFYRQISISL